MAISRIQERLKWAHGAPRAPLSGSFANWTILDRENSLFAGNNSVFIVSREFCRNPLKLLG